MISDTAQAWQIMRQRFKDAWADGTPVQWPNQPFIPPTGRPWARFEITEGGTANAVVGTTQVRSVGVIWIGVNVPVKTGLKTALQLAELAAVIFRNQRFEGIRCHATEIRDAGEHGGWRLVTVVTPYIYDIFSL